MLAASQCCRPPCQLSSPRVSPGDFIDRQAQKRSLISQGNLSLPGTRSASILAARWLAFSSADPPLSFTNVILKVQSRPEKMRDLATVLLCTENGLVRMARKFPAIFAMEPDDVFYRLTSLKTELPRCNVAGMVHGQPVLFLSRPRNEVMTQVSTAYNLYRQELPYMDVDTVIQEQPATLFINKEQLLSGLPGVKSMTDPHATDSTTVANLIWAIFGKPLEDAHDQYL